MTLFIPNCKEPSETWSLMWDALQKTSQKLEFWSQLSQLSHLGIVVRNLPANAGDLGSICELVGKIP